MKNKKVDTFIYWVETIENNTDIYNIAPQIYSQTSHRRKSVKSTVLSNLPNFSGAQTQDI